MSAESTNDKHALLPSAADMEEELSRLFDAGPGSGLRIKVHGEEDVHTAVSEAAFRELISSLRMYHQSTDLSDGTPVERAFTVDTPSAAIIRKALSVLTVDRQQKRLLDRMLTRLGHRLIDPLASMLELPSEDVLAKELRTLRELFITQIEALQLTFHTQRRLTVALTDLLTDGYLQHLAEQEIKVQRPQVTTLAQRILRAVGASFHQAFRCWPENADRLAVEIAERMTERVNLRDLPVLLRDQVVSAIEEFLWRETEAELREALQQLSEEYHMLLPRPLTPLGREDYRALAELCWEQIAEHC